MPDTQSNLGDVPNNLSQRAHRRLIGRAGGRVSLGRSLHRSCCNTEELEEAAMGPALATGRGRLGPVGPEITRVLSGESGAVLPDRPQ